MSNIEIKRVILYLSVLLYIGRFLRANAGSSTVLLKYCIILILRFPSLTYKRDFQSFTQEKRSDIAEDDQTLKAYLKKNVNYKK